MKEILQEKPSGYFTKFVLFLQEKTPAHPALATQKKLAYLGFQHLDHPPYCPDLAPPDCQLFPGLKKTIESSPFSSDAEVIAAAETWLDRQISDIFGETCRSYSNELKSVFAGSMLNKSRVSSL